MVTNVVIKEFEEPVAEDRDEAAAIWVDLKDWPVQPPLTNGTEHLVVLPQSSFALGTLRDGRLRVVEPIEVERTTDSGQCVLEATEVNEFGFGENLSEAIADLQAAIAELYFTLEEKQERLGRDLAKVWATLSRKIYRVDAARSA